MILVAQLSCVQLQATGVICKSDSSETMPLLGLLLFSGQPKAYTSTEQQTLGHFAAAHSLRINP